MFSMVRYKMVQVKLGQSSLNKKVYQTSQFWVWLHDLEPHLPIVFREIRMMPCKNYLWGKPVTWLSLDQTSSDYLRGLIWLNILDGFCWISFFRSLASPAAHGAVMEGWRFLCPVPWIQNQWPVLWSFSAPTFSKNMPCINSELRKLGSSNNLPSMHRLKSFRKIHGPLGYKGFGFATACDLGHDWWSNPSASKSMKLISPNVDPYNDRPLKRPYSKKTTTKSRGFWTLLKWWWTPWRKITNHQGKKIPYLLY